MAIYDFEAPHFMINETRAADDDTLVGSMALTVKNELGALHHRWDAIGQSYGDRGDGSLLASGLMFDGVDVPGPTRDAPDGGSVCWTFTLGNKGHADDGFVQALNKLTDGFTGALADKTLDAVQAGDVGAAFTTFLLDAGVVGAQEVVNLLVADCDGGVASAAFEFTAAELAQMTAAGGVWQVVKDNPGTNSPAGCGDNSDYQVAYRISVPGDLRWSGEEDLGGILTSEPAAAAWALNRLDVFYRGQNQHLWHRSWDGAGWSGEDDRGGILSSGPTVASWGPDRLDVFYPGQNQHLYHRSWDGGWSGEDDRGGILTSSAAAAAWGPNRLDVFYRGQNQHLWHRSWDGGWSGEEDLGGTLASSPAVAARGPNRLDIFYRGPNNTLLHRWWDGNAWNGEEDLGGNVGSDPAVAAWGPNRLDVFYAAPTRTLLHRWWDGNAWNGEEDLGGDVPSGPAATSWGPHRLDVFYRGPNDHLLHRWFPAW